MFEFKATGNRYEYTVKYLDPTLLDKMLPYFQEVVDLRISEILRAKWRDRLSKIVEYYGSQDGEDSSPGL